MALSIRDILILDYFDGKPVHHKIPPYKLKIYGQDANDRIGLLYENGWIRYSRPQETVSMLPDKALSDFLKRYGLSGEGSHAELTGRVISRIPRVRLCPRRAEDLRPHQGRQGGNRASHGLRPERP